MILAIPVYLSAEIHSSCKYDEQANASYQQGSIFQPYQNKCKSIQKAEHTSKNTCSFTASEMMNSALEKLCDHIHPAFHQQIKIVKDVAAGGVLLISLMSAFVGTLIFMPKIWNLL